MHCFIFRNALVLSMCMKYYQRVCVCVCVCVAKMSIYQALKYIDIYIYGTLQYGVLIPFCRTHVFVPSASEKVGSCQLFTQFLFERGLVPIYRRAAH